MADAETRVDDLFIEPVGEITPEYVTINKTSGVFEYADAAAVKLVLGDTGIADAYLNQNQWSAGWTLAGILYQSPSSQSAFDGGNVGSSNVPKYLLSNHLSSIVPKIMSGIFYEKPPFLLRPAPSVDQSVVEEKTALLTFQLNEMQFEEETERAISQGALLGTLIMKWGYQEYSKKVRTYRRAGDKDVLNLPTGQVVVDSPIADDFKVEYDDKLVSHPWIKFCDIRTVLVDPATRVGDIRKAKWVVYRDFATYQDLDRLRDVEGYNIPSEALLKEMFSKKISTGNDNITLTLPEGMQGYLQHALPRAYKTSTDPNQQAIEILERWDEQKVIVILCYNGHNILIRNEENPYGKIPFYSANWRDIDDCFYGQGLGILIGSEQLVEQGVTNLAIDLLAYGLQPTAIRKKGFNTPTQDVRWGQGKIIDVDDNVNDAFKFMQMPPVPPEAWQFIQQAQSSAASTSGANEQVIQGAGSPGVRTTGMRSATGAAAVIQANASRLDGPDGRFIRQVFEPWLHQMNELNNYLLPTSVMRDVLGEQMGKPYAGDHIDFRKANLKFEVLAGANLGAKKEMAQALPIIIQLLNNPTFASNLADSGKIFDADAIFNAFTAAAGWRYSQKFVRDMTPEEKQKRDANSPAALQAKQAQSQQQMQLAQFQHETQLEDARQLGKAANEVLRQTTQHTLTSEELNGEPGNSGFGSETGL